MQNALGACRRSRSIDEKGRIAGGRVGPRCARTSRDHAGNLVIGKRAHATGQSCEAETLPNSNCLHTGGVQQKVHLGFGKLGGCRHRYESACYSAEEDKRVGARILQANEDARAGSKTRRFKAGSDTQDGFFELRECPDLGGRGGCGVMHHHKSLRVWSGRRCRGNAIGRHIEMARRRFLRGTCSRYHAFKRGGVIGSPRTTNCRGCSRRVASFRDA